MLLVHFRARFLTEFPDSVNFLSQGSCSRGLVAASYYKTTLRVIRRIGAWGLGGGAPQFSGGIGGGRSPLRLRGCPGGGNPRRRQLDPWNKTPGKENSLNQQIRSKIEPGNGPKA